MCNCNNTTTTTQNHVCKPKCPPQEDCTCPVQIKSSCVTMYDGNDLECSGIQSGLPLNQTIELLDNYICEAIDEINASINLVNVGEGEDIYAGIDGIGRRKIKRVNTDSTLLTITPNTDDITFGIDEEALDTFIEDNQKTYSADNVGAGAEVYKDSTIVGDNTQFNFRTVVQEDQGTGESFLRDIQQTTDELKVRVKTLVSDNLTITATDEEVRIETPMTASIPALYVNDLYQPTYQEWLSENSSQNAGVPVIGFQYIGKGTLAQPFTDTYVYTLGAPATPPIVTADSAVQNALDGDTTYSYVGSGTRLLPEKAGQKIKIQDNTVQYNFTGTFSYDRLDLEVNANVNHIGSGYLVDMDNVTYFNTNQHSVTITIGEGYLITSEGDGLNNSGSNIATNNYYQSKTIILKGKGTLYFPNNNIIKYALNSDILSTGNNNDGNVTFQVECSVRSDYQGVYKIGGDSRIFVYGKLISGVYNITVDTSLKAFVHLGGQVRFFKGSEIAFTGARVDGFVFTPTGGFTPTFTGNSPTIVSTTNITNLFNKTNNNTVIFVLKDSQSGVLLSVTNIFESTNLWSVTFNGNTFESGLIDPTKVDLTNSNSVSSINTIGANIIESLRIFNNRAAAISAGVPLYSAYLKTEGAAYPTTLKWVRDIVLPA